MKRKSFLRLFVEGIGYMALGNVMCTVMTVALGAFLENFFMQLLAQIFTTFIFYSLVYTAGYRDGLRESSMVRLKRVDAPIKGRWIRIGFAMFGVMAIPSVLLLLDNLLKLFTDNYLIPFRFICGSIYPLATMLGVVDVDKMPVFMPFIFMAFYLLIPLVAQFGFFCAFNDKLRKGDFMYEKK